MEDAHNAENGERSSRKQLGESRPAQHRTKTWSTSTETWKTNTILHVCFSAFLSPCRADGDFLMGMPYVIAGHLW